MNANIQISEKFVMKYWEKTTMLVIWSGKQQHNQQMLDKPNMAYKKRQNQFWFTGVTNRRMRLLNLNNPISNSTILTMENWVDADSK